MPPSHFPFYSLSCCKVIHLHQSPGFPECLEIEIWRFAIRKTAGRTNYSTTQLRSLMKRTRHIFKFYCYSSHLLLTPRREWWTVKPWPEPLKRIDEALKRCNKTVKQKSCEENCNKTVAATTTASVKQVFLPLGLRSTCSVGWARVRRLSDTTAVDN